MVSLAASVWFENLTLAKNTCHWMAQIYVYIHAKHDNMQM